VYIPVAEETPVISALLQPGWSLRAGEAYRLRSRPFVRATISLVAPAEIEMLADAIPPRCDRSAGPSPHSPLFHLQ